MHIAQRTREQCLLNLGEVAPALLPFADLFSRRESQYFFWDGAALCHKLKATDGVDQGDPLAPLLFACGLRPRLQELEGVLQDLAAAQGLPRSNVKVLAFLDDVAVITPPEIAAQVFPSAQRIFGAFGLELSDAKTQAWSPASARPADLEQRFWREEGLTLVGVPLGDALPASGVPDHEDAVRVDFGDVSFTEARCMEVGARAEVFLERLAELPVLASPHLPAVQAAALLLRLCGVGKITHLLRTNPPAQVSAAARSFDTALMQAYEAIAALDPMSSEQAEQCCLSLRQGGRGLRSQERTAPAAWVGSWAQCVSEVLERSGVAALSDLETCGLPLAAACRQALVSLPTALPSDKDDEALPPWQELAQEPRKRCRSNSANGLIKNT